jgi:hypothetical protein
MEGGGILKYDSYVYVIGGFDGNEDEFINVV